MTSKDIHPVFKNKPVVILECKACGQRLSNRGMLASLLADRYVRLYSTDIPLFDCVYPTGNPYKTRKCNCNIRDLLCMSCGDEIGYTVVNACKSCLSSLNNGHMWMFSSDVVCAEKYTNQHGKSMLWGEFLDSDEYYTTMPSSLSDSYARDRHGNDTDSGVSAGAGLAAAVGLGRSSAASTEYISDDLLCIR